MRVNQRTKFGIVGILAVATGISGAILPSTAADAAVPQSWIDEQVDFILSQQLDSGAILGTTVAATSTEAAHSNVNPYFNNIAALGLLAADTTDSRAGALAWMQWNLGHLNAAATNVPAYSIFDFKYYPGTDTIVSKGDFDSVDSYASTTLNVAYAAYQTGDSALQAYVASNIATYEAIANILNYDGTIGVRVTSGGAAGLTIAKPSYAMPYTMDNAEVYSGLRDFSLLEADLGRTSQAGYYGAWADTTQDAIVDLLWNSTNDNWDWAYLNSSDTDNFYADATAQLWPALMGVVEASDAKASSAWGQFTASWPTWYQNGEPDAYPWVSMALAGQVMGDWDDADSHLADVHSRYAPGGFTYPTACGAAVCGQWYVAEAGQFILASIASNVHALGD